MTFLVSADRQPCTVHHRHSPRNLTTEFHHTVPVAWQLRTPLGQGVAPPASGPDPDGRGMLWDARGVWICPTGHRNVHVWIVSLMRAVADSGSEDPAAALARVRPRRVPLELPLAVQALERFGPFGSLLALTQAGDWGQA